MINNFKEISKFATAVNSDNFKLTLDIAHANTTGLPPVDFVKDLREYIGHVHISDNTGDNEHLPIGMGNIDFEEFLRTLHPYDGFLIIEGWIPQNQDHFLKWDKKKLEEIIARL